MHASVFSRAFGDLGEFAPVAVRIRPGSPCTRTWRAARSLAGALWHGGGRLLTVSAALVVLWATLAAPFAQAWNADRIISASQRYGEQATQAIRAIGALAAAHQQDELAKVNAINGFFNRRLFFKSDLDLWGIDDYWASPLETLAKGAGDCEDYAIAKYFTLVSLGVPEEKLRLVYVRMQMGGAGGPAQAHVVLAYYPTDVQTEPLILDNVISEMRPASRRPDLTPVFSFNSEGLWSSSGNPATSPDTTGPQRHLARWPAVVAKARADGFLR